MTTPALRLPNPVPYEMVAQMARHLGLWKPELGMSYAFEKIDISPMPISFENANISEAKKGYVCINADIDECLDPKPDLRTNGITNYQSTVFLNAYIYHNKNPQLARALFQADFHRYFFNKPESPNYSPSIGEQNWTLYNPNFQQVVHELYIQRANIVATHEKKPMIQVDMELTVWWGALNSDLNTPR